MADAFSLNEKVSITNALYVVWRLTRVLKSAGWTVTQSGDGTSYGASDYWTTYAGLGTSAWIVLTGPGGRQLCFWRSTTSTEPMARAPADAGRKGSPFRPPRAKPPPPPRRD